MGRGEHLHLLSPGLNCFQIAAVYGPPEPKWHLQQVRFDDVADGSGVSSTLDHTPLIKWPTPCQILLSRIMDLKSQVRTRALLCSAPHTRRLSLLMIFALLPPSLLAVLHTTQWHTAEPCDDYGERKTIGE